MRKITVAIALIIVGITMMVYTGFNIVTNEKVVDVGPIKITKEKSHPIEWSSWVGLVLLISGVFVFVQAKRGLK